MSCFPLDDGVSESMVRHRWGPTHPPVVGHSVRYSPPAFPHGPGCERRSDMGHGRDAVRHESYRGGEGWAKPWESPELLGLLELMVEY